MPLKLTDDVARKPVPFTVSVNCGDPAVTLVGDREVITGAGLELAVPLWLTVKVSQPATIVSVRGDVDVFWATE